MSRRARRWCGACSLEALGFDGSRGRMSARMLVLRERCAQKLRPVLRTLVRVSLHIGIWKKDQVFLRMLGNPLVGRPSLLGWLYALQASAWRALEGMWREAYTEYALQIYTDRNRTHYAKGGRGYLNLDNPSTQECADQFAGLTSRLKLFLDAYPVTVAYKDGESFLDAGCGKGQNLKFIMDRYPNSPYTGFDIDERCLQVARTGVAGSARRSLMQGSILDFDFLKSFKDKTVDHICVCHVFSTLLEPSMQQTKLSHQRIIDEFVRISRKSIMIIDNMSLGKSFRVEIEQLTRAMICENIASYFIKHQSAGETCILPHEYSCAVLFKSTVS